MNKKQNKTEESIGVLKKVQIRKLFCPVIEKANNGCFILDTDNYRLMV